MSCLCLRELETIDHLFLHFDFTSKGRTVLNTFGLDSCLPKKIDDLIMDGLMVEVFLEKEKSFGVMLSERFYRIFG